MQEWYDSNKDQLEALDESLERLNNLAPRLEKIDPGELTITEGLSKEGFENTQRLILTSGCVYLWALRIMSIIIS